MKAMVLALTAVVTLGGVGAASAASSCSVSLTNDPVVMRINKDEFRIVFGVEGDKCPASGCAGTIAYTAAWKTEDGLTSTDVKHVNYKVPNGATRSIAVDRHYFDTAEGQHTTDIVHVNVDKVSCSDAIAAR
jgi:hypothetical protein